MQKIFVVTCMFFMTLLSFTCHVIAQETGEKMISYKVAVEWIDQPWGEIQILNGNFVKIDIANGEGKVEGNKFHFTSKGRARILLHLKGKQDQFAPEPTMVYIKTKDNSFSFFIRDVNENYPIYSPDYGVVILKSTDERGYGEIENAVLNKKQKSRLEIIESQSEMSYEIAEKNVVEQDMPIWLGVGRDVRMFEVSLSSRHHPKQLNTITSQYISQAVQLDEADGREAVYSYAVGRGQGVEVKSTKQLEDGVLPILNSDYLDNDIRYHSTFFVSFIESTLSDGNNEGTPSYISDMFSNGYRYSPGYVKEKEDKLRNQLPDLLNRNNNVALYFRTMATNESDVPRYAWFKTAGPGAGWSASKGYKYSFDGVTGFSSYSEDKVFAVSKINGNPLPSEEFATLIMPGETVIFEFYIPHTPVSFKKAEILYNQSFSKHYESAIRFWQDKLLVNNSIIQIPEKRIQNMLQAGLLHLDLVTFGSESEDVLAANAGRFLPIGTESAPIIQYYCSRGWFETAKKTLNYFLIKQHESGSLMNYQDYMVETGAVLWSIGEYFRYTKDSTWIKKVSPRLYDACNFLMDWRNENKIDNLYGTGYGMINGKVADPDDLYRQFMLNGYGYLGLKRMAEIFKAIGLPEYNLLSLEAENWRKDIRISFRTALGRSPLIPKSDGTWIPTAPPWVESVGPRALYVKDEKYFSHGTFTAPDNLLGPIYLIFCEVIEPDEWLTEKILDFQNELLLENNTAFSQPYYSRHNWVQLKRGMVKPFLQTYYYTMAAMADRNIYTFTEHTYPNSVHKVHEEAWFLMETRWMLYSEEDTTLNLFKAVPRSWLGNGNNIIIDNMYSYFGPITVTVQSDKSGDKITAEIECHDSSNQLQDIVVRLPHPEGRFPVRVEGGEYDKINESIYIGSFRGNQKITLYYE